MSHGDAADTHSNYGPKRELFKHKLATGDLLLLRKVPEGFRDSQARLSGKALKIPQGISFGLSSRP